MDFTAFKALFFSGTGNSRRVAQWLMDGAESRHIHGECLPLSESAISPESAEARTLIGLTFPTHGFTAPWAVIRAVWNMPRGRGAAAVVVPTRGAFRVSRFKIPGMEGTGGYLIALLLWLKGYLVRGVMAVDMPVSWTAVHPALSQRSVELITEPAEKKTGRFMDEILSGRTCFSGWICLILGILFLPVTFLYLAMGRFFLAKLFFANYHCTSCGLCAEICPVKAIRMYGGRPYWTFQCESCMRCMSFCPTKAVEASHSLAVISFFLSLVPVTTYFIHFLGKYFGCQFSPIVNGLLFYLYSLIAFYLVYVLFFILIRIRTVNIFFTYTTLTHWFKRYRAPRIRIEDLCNQKNKL